MTCVNISKSQSLCLGSLCKLQFQCDVHIVGENYSSCLNFQNGRGQNAEVQDVCVKILYYNSSLILKVLSQSRLLEKTIKFLDVLFAAGLEAGDQCTALCYPSLESFEATGGGALKLLNMLHCSWTVASPGAREDDQSQIKVTDKWKSITDTVICSLLRFFEPLWHCSCFLLCFGNRPFFSVSFFLSFGA